MESGGRKTTSNEDGLTSEAPLYSLEVEVVPQVREFDTRKTTSGARVAPIAAAAGERLEEGGLVRDLGLNGEKGNCLGRTTGRDGQLLCLEAQE